MEEDGQYDDDEATDDDMAKEEDDSPWFTVVMTKEEKKEARKKWNLSVIIKLVGKTIWYHYLLHRIQTLWRPQRTFFLIDLPNGFIVKFSHRTDYDVVLLNGSWMINDHYLYVQQWVPNFIADEA